MPNQSSDPLATLARRFEAEASRVPGLRHVLTVAHVEHHDRITGPPWCSDAAFKWGGAAQAVHHRDTERLGASICSGGFYGADSSAREAFSALAAAAWSVLSKDIRDGLAEPDYLDPRRAAAPERCWLLSLYTMAWQRRAPGLIADRSLFLAAPGGSGVALRVDLESMIRSPERAEGFRAGTAFGAGLIPPAERQNIRIPPPFFAARLGVDLFMASRLAADALAASGSGGLVSPRPGYARTADILSMLKVHRDNESGAAKRLQRERSKRGFGIEVIDPKSHRRTWHYNVARAKALLSDLSR